MTDLAPIFRSPLTAQILQLLLVLGGTWTADDLVKRTEAAYPTVTRELRRLERTGVVRTTLDGRTKFFTANGRDPAVRALTRAVDLGVPSRGGEGMAKKKSKKKGKKKK